MKKIAIPGHARGKPGVDYTGKNNQLLEVSKVPAGGEKTTST